MSLLEIRILRFVNRLTNIKIHQNVVNDRKKIRKFTNLL